MQLIKRELMGGPFDGEWHTVPPTQETLALRDGHSLCRYNLDEIYDGKTVRVVYRYVAKSPALDK
jgi:hypothetical protein